MITFKNILVATDFGDPAKHAREMAIAIARKFDSKITRAASPADGIIVAARELPADLIVMGTQGRRGVSHFILGSVAENVVRLAGVPVLTVSAKAKV